MYRDGAVPELAADRRKRVRTRRTPPEDPRLRTVVTLKDAAVTGKERDERPQKAKTLSLLLNDLAAQTPLLIVAECEYQPKEQQWLSRQLWLSEDIVRKPLYRALDLLCADFEYEWTFKDGALQLRPLRWYLPLKERNYVIPDYREVPAFSPSLSN